MTDTVSLTIKIDPALKETLKTLALENQLSLSQEVSQRLQASLFTAASGNRFPAHSGRAAGKRGGGDAG